MAHAVAAVVARFGPAQAVVAHSMGAMSPVLVPNLDVDRLVLVAPMDRLSAALEMFDLARLMSDLPEMPILVLHDVGDRMTPHASTLR